MTCKLHGTYKSYKYIELINTYNTYVTSKMILPKHGDSPNGEMRMTPAETVSTSAPRPLAPQGMSLSFEAVLMGTSGWSIVTRLIWGYLGETVADVYGCLWMFMVYYWYTISIYFLLL